MKLIGVLHKTATAQKINQLKEAGLTDARIHLSKMPAERYNSLILAASAENLGVYIDTRGNKPTILNLLHGGQSVDSVNVSRGMRFLFFTGKPAADAAGYEAVFELSYMPQVMKDQEGKSIAIDDGNILLTVDQIYETNNLVTSFATTVSFIDLDKVDAIYHEGISSFEIPIHSHAQTLLTEYDLDCLNAVSPENRQRVDYVGISFAETGAQIALAHQTLRRLGFYKAKAVAKIETELGVANIRNIAEELVGLYGSEAEIWVARGDLSVVLRDQAKVIEAEQKIFNDLKDIKVSIIVATNVANSLRYYKPGQQLTSAEAELVNQEISQGAAGFMLAAELYAGPEQKGEDAQEVVATVNKYLERL